jgi:hypothetical protein
MKWCTTNPTDVLLVEALIDDINRDLKTLRAGIKCLRKSWHTSSAGLLTAARAASSLRVRTGECSALLSSMLPRDGELTQEEQKMLSSSSGTLWML